MNKKRKCKTSNPPPKPMFYYDKMSMRGGLVKTKDGIAIFVAFISMLLFLFVGFFLGVITDDSEGGENEKNNQTPNKIERLYDWIIK